MGLRGVTAILFAITILSLPPQAIAPLVFLFAAYLAADGDICDPGRDASPALALSLADVVLRGLVQSRSRGCRSRLAGGCRCCARSDRCCLGGHYWRPAA